MFISQFTNRETHQSMDYLSEEMSELLEKAIIGKTQNGILPKKVNRNLFKKGLQELAHRTEYRISEITREKAELQERAREIKKLYQEEEKAKVLTMKRANQLADSFNMLQLVYNECCQEEENLIEETGAFLNNMFTNFGVTICK